MSEYTNTEKEVFLYLFELQESGVTNMFGARPYLQRAFPLLDSSTSQDLLSRWMNDYNNIRKDLVKNDSPNLLN